MEDKLNKDRWNLFAIFFWSVAVLGFLYMFVSFAYEAFYIPPDFDNLSIKKGKLTDIDKCKHRRGGRSYIPAKIIIDGMVEDIKLPCDQQVSLLNNEIGESIEIRYDPRYVSLLSRRINILHISTDNRVYYDYHKKIEKLSKTNKDNQNVLYIITVLTALVALKNYRTLKEYFSKPKGKDHREDTNIKDEITFKFSNIKVGFLLYMVSLPTVVCMYYGLFVYPLFLVFGIPLAILLLWGLCNFKKIKHDITLSPYGIRYELFRKTLGTDTLGWSEIEHIKILQLKTELILIKLADRERTSSLIKIGNSSYDLNLNPAKFEDSDYLKKMIFEMHKSYENRNIKFLNKS